MSLSNHSAPVYRALFMNRGGDRLLSSSFDKSVKVRNRVWLLACVLVA